MSQPETYSRAIVSIPSRPVVSGVTKSLLPVFIVVVAAAALLLKPEHIEARVGLSITALLTLVALQFSAQAALPDVGYLLMFYHGPCLSRLRASGRRPSGDDRTGNAEDKNQLAAAHSLAKGGLGTAVLSILRYATAIGLVLWLNRTRPTRPDGVRT